MRVGVFIDGFNLYYGARMVCGHDTQGWKWLDLAGLVAPRLTSWGAGGITEIHYCTARRGRDGSGRSVDQEVYLASIVEHDPRVQIHLGKYVVRNRQGVLLDGRRRAMTWPSAGVPEWLTAREVTGPEGAPEILVSVRAFEEKGSDVNVAVALVAASVGGAIDGAVVISNDSDLAFALRTARTRVPVGLLNPGSRPTAADLRDSPHTGVGGHWWGRLQRDDYRTAQLPERVGEWQRPADW